MRLTKRKTEPTCTVLYRGGGGGRARKPSLEEVEFLRRKIPSEGSLCRWRCSNATEKPPKTPTHLQSEKLNPITFTWNQRSQLAEKEWNKPSFPTATGHLILFCSFLMFLNIPREIKLSLKCRKKTPHIHSELHEPNLHRSNGVTGWVVPSEPLYLDIASCSTSFCF